jgi:hypothetical protein
VPFGNKAKGHEGIFMPFLLLKWETFFLFALLQNDDIFVTENH